MRRRVEINKLQAVEVSTTKQQHEIHEYHDCHNLSESLFAHFYPSHLQQLQLHSVNQTSSKLALLLVMLLST